MCLSMEDRPVTWVSRRNLYAQDFLTIRINFLDIILNQYVAGNFATVLQAIPQIFPVSCDFRGFFKSLELTFRNA